MPNMHPVADQKQTHLSKGSLVSPDATKVSHRQHQEACYVLGTSIPDSQLSELEVIDGYKGQGAVERGFRFLKAPVFFVSSL